MICPIFTTFRRYPATGRAASFKSFKAHALGVRSVCFLDKGSRSEHVVSVGGKDRCVMQVGERPVERNGTIRYHTIGLSVWQKSIYIRLRRRCSTIVTEKLPNTQPFHRWSAYFAMAGIWSCLPSDSMLHELQCWSLRIRIPERTKPRETKNGILFVVRSIPFDGPWGCFHDSSFWVTSLRKVRCFDNRQNNSLLIWQ